MARRAYPLMVTRPVDRVGVCDPLFMSATLGSNTQQRKQKRVLATNQCLGVRLNLRIRACICVQSGLACCWALPVVAQGGGFILSRWRDEWNRYSD